MIFLRVVLKHEEDDVRKSIAAAMGLALGSLALMTGCGPQGNKSDGIPVGPKWKGAPYRLTLDAKAPAPNPSGVTLPNVKFTANPDALETRASLVVHFDASSAKTSGTANDQMIVGPFDISGPEGTLPADYMTTADQGLSRLFGAYCMKGKINVSVAIARSSLSPQATESEVDEKRLSDWLPVQIVFKNPHPKC